MRLQRRTIDISKIFCYAQSVAEYVEAGCRLLLGAVLAHAQYDFACAYAAGQLDDEGKVLKTPPKRSNKGHRDARLTRKEINELSAMSRCNSWVHGLQSVAFRPLTSPQAFRAESLQLRLKHDGRVRRFYIPRTDLNHG